MVRRSFIREITDQKMELIDKLHDLLFYNKPICFVRHVGRFLVRLPDYLKLCWENETWDYEGLYNFIEVFLKQLRKAQEEDTWHAPHGIHRAIQQIDLTLAHLDRYRNWPNYYEWPEPRFEETENHPKYGRLSKIVYDDPDAEEKMNLVHRMEEKHYNAFWRLLKKYHNNWWT